MKKIGFPAALIAVAAILMRPEAAAAGAQQAMRVWFTSVAPSLFPFLVLMPLLTGSEACAVYDMNVITGAVTQHADTMIGLLAVEGPLSVGDAP